MNNRKSKLVPISLLVVVSLACLITSCSVGGSPGADGAANPTAGAPNLVGDNDAFLARLQAEGFVVEEGSLRYVDLFKLADDGVLQSCFGNNAANPYLVYYLPQAPGEIRTEKDALLGAFQLRPDEAVVLVGKTPPDMAYFSYRSYLLKRYYDQDLDYRVLFASLGDSMNKLTIKTVNTPDGAAGDPTSSPTMIITTADQGIDRRIRGIASAAGYSPSIINTDVIPSSIVRLGLGDGFDVFTFVNRFALLRDLVASENYKLNPEVRVFRLRPQVPAALEPFETPALRTRGNGVTESALAEALEDLRQAILTRHGAHTAQELAIGSSIPEGYTAIQNGQNALGDNRDTTYLNTDLVLLPDHPDHFIIAYGVNHTVAGKATYSNLGVYGSKYLNGVGGANSNVFPGSADYYIPGHPMADYLYAWKVARQADGHPYCYEVPIDDSPYGVGLLTPATVAFRAYLEPGTRTGPAYVELLQDRAIKFTP